MFKTHTTRSHFHVFTSYEHKVQKSFLLLCHFTGHVKSNIHDFCGWGACPATSHKGFRKFAATVSLGESRVLQAPGSEVCLQIPEGAPGVYLTQVHTEFSKLKELLTDSMGDECVISPIVDVKFSSLESNLGETQPRQKCTLSVPHCIQEQAKWQHIRVAHHSAAGNNALVEHMSWNRSHVPALNTFRVTPNFIHITTDTFSKFVCTCGEVVCRARIFIFLFVKLDKQRAEGLLGFLWGKGTTTVDINTILGSNLYTLQDFKNVSKTYLTNGFLVLFV